MPKFLFHGSYTLDGMKGLMQEGGSGRRDAAVQLLESVGGRLEAIYFAFGGDDFYVLADMPDNVSAATAALRAAASGALNINTVVLLTPEEIDEATGRSATYRPPGQ